MTRASVSCQGVQLPAAGNLSAPNAVSDTHEVLSKWRELCLVPGAQQTQFSSALGSTRKWSSGALNMGCRSESQQAQSRSCSVLRHTPYPQKPDWIRYNPVAGVSWQAARQRAAPQRPVRDLCSSQPCRSHMHSQGASKSGQCP